MKIRIPAWRMVFMVAVTFITAKLQSPASGIPEPGLVLYGSVTNTAGSFALMAGGVQWTASGAGSTTIANATIANVNGQYFYVAHLPFETRAVPGTTFTPTPNTLPLTDTTTSFSRAARVMGTNASIAPPALPSFNFSKADRGRVERVDLLANLPSVPPPNLDTDGDGVPDWAEQIAGTNPNDPSSVFKASADIQPAAGGGLVVKWASVAGKSYSVLRTTNVGQGFTPLAGSLSATPPLNQFTDSAATAAGPYFYRILVNP